MSIKFQLLMKGKIVKNKDSSQILYNVFILLINIEMSTIVGMSTFVSRINQLFAFQRFCTGYISCSVKLSMKIFYTSESDPEGIKHFSCSTQLSMKFQTLIKGKRMKNNDLSCFKTLRYCIYPATKC